MNIRIFVIFMFSCSSYFMDGQALTAKELIKKSLEVHDPKGEWATFKDNLNIAQTRPDGKASERYIHLNNKKNHFSFRANYPEGELKYVVDKKGARYSWNGDKKITEELKKKYRVSDERANMYHNYYAYLYGMPMKLSDPGTHVSPVVENVKFKDESYLRVKVSYDPEVGNDVWYFYFNPNNYELELYQFFHDESKNDGEYILLEGWKHFGQLKLPEKLQWYYNKDDGFLGEDRLIK